MIMQIVDEINNFNPDDRDKEENALRARMTEIQRDLAKLLRTGYAPQPEPVYDRREEISRERWAKDRARRKASDKRRKARKAAAR